MSFTSTYGRSQVIRGRINSMSGLPAFSLMQHDANVCVSATLTSVFGHGRAAARDLAEAANCNERTALGWLSGTATPDFVHTMRLIAAIPKFAAEVQRITGLEASNHPAFQEEFIKLARAAVSHMDAKP